MPKRVLIVDDTVFMRSMLRNIFSEAGWEVVAEATNGRQAVSEYEHHHPDLVLMDLVMPELGGLEALKNIIFKDSRARVVVCSALGQKNLIMEALNAGAKDYVVKPFDKEFILTVADRAVNETPTT